MRGTSIRHFRRGAGKLLRDQRGNMMMMTAAAIVPIIGIVGSAVDIGRAYMAELRLQQACDAGVLAGRRAMSGGTYSAAAQAEANKMFNFNYPSTIYGSSDVSFSSVAQGSSTVNGTATASLPVALMQIFNFSSFNLSVSCSAKLEISNTDVMMVLDVTGSMDNTNAGDSVSRLEALKLASMEFFDTLTEAELGDGRLRFGIVPYSGTVNVGSILLAGNPDWLSDTIKIPSRTAKFTTSYSGGTTTNGTATNGTNTNGSWSNSNSTNYATTSSACSALSAPANSTTTTSGNASSTQTGQTTDANDVRTTTSNTMQNYTYTQYQYVWSNSKCRLQQRSVTYTQTTPSTLVQQPTYTFASFTYENRDENVHALKSGTPMSLKTGTRGVSESFSWDGCIMERATTSFGPTTTAPAGAYDMNIDMVPTSSDDTKWKLFMPEFVYSRNSSSTTTSTSTNNVDSMGDTADAGGDIGACPPPAKRLTTMTKADRATFAADIAKLKAQGFTYHDTGMAWGARLISPDGLFASDNTTAPNGRPIGRHIVFMTDGQMDNRRSNYSHQGLEQVIARIGGSSDADLVSRHNNRFAQLCSAAKAKNITIWVVSFGTSLTTQLSTCATADKAYSASNSAQLNEHFQSIARQISKLRLSQ